MEKPSKYSNQAVNSAQVSSSVSVSEDVRTLKQRIRDLEFQLQESKRDTRDSYHVNFEQEEQYKKENEKLKTELFGAQIRAKKATEKKEEIERAWKTVIEENSCLRTGNEKNLRYIQTELQETQKKLQQAEADVEYLEKQYEEQQIILKKLEQELNHIQSQNAQLSQALEEEKNKKIQTQSDKNKQEIASLKAELEFAQIQAEDTANVLREQVRLLRQQLEQEKQRAEQKEKNWSLDKVDPNAVKKKKVDIDSFINKRMELSDEEQMEIDLKQSIKKEVEKTLNNSISSQATIDVNHYLQESKWQSIAKGTFLGLFLGLVISFFGINGLLISNGSHSLLTQLFEEERDNATTYAQSNVTPKQTGWIKGVIEDMSKVDIQTNTTQLGDQKVSIHKNTASLSQSKLLNSSNNDNDNELDNNKAKKDQLSHKSVIIASVRPTKTTEQTETKQSKTSKTFKLSAKTVFRDKLKNGMTSPKLVVIPAGEFKMGRNLGGLHGDEGPAHHVELPMFAITQHEITFEEYDYFAKRTGRHLPDDEGWGRGKRPVINITWDDAVAYAQWLSKQTGQTYRLPSESEWEYAAGTGKRSFYWWGYKIAKNKANCFDCGSKWDRRSTAPVGSFDANPFGLYDTAGNVNEWVQDCKNRSYDGKPKDASAWEEGDCSQRMVRGGSFNNTAEKLQTTTRSSFPKKDKSNNLGFRLVREIDS